MIPLKPFYFLLWFQRGVFDGNYGALMPCKTECRYGEIGNITGILRLGCWKETLLKEAGPHSFLLAKCEKQLKARPTCEF